MTRSTLKRALRRVYALLVLVLGISLLAKVADHMPMLDGSGVEKFLKDIYEYLRDMSLLIATGGVAYITNMFQKRTSFGETHDLIGLYPYAPLHDMRRALQTLDPRKNPNLDTQARNLVRDAILQSFYALRETFLEELDLEEPDHPLLISSGRRAKKSGSTSSARRAQDRQRARQDRALSPDSRIDDLLAELYAKENSTAKPWRQPAGAGAPSPNGRSA